MEERYLYERRRSKEYRPIKLSPTEQNRASPISLSFVREPTSKYLTKMATDSKHSSYDDKKTKLAVKMNKKLKEIIDTNHAVATKNQIPHVASSTVNAMTNNAASQSTSVLTRNCALPTVAYATPSANYGFPPSNYSINLPSQEQCSSYILPSICKQPTVTIHIDAPHAKKIVFDNSNFYNDRNHLLKYSSSIPNKTALQTGHTIQKTNSFQIHIQQQDYLNGKLYSNHLSPTKECMVSFE